MSIQAHFCRPRLRPIVGLSEAVTLITAQTRGDPAPGSAGFLGGRGGTSTLPGSQGGPGNRTGSYTGGGTDGPSQPHGAGRRHEPVRLHVRIPHDREDTVPPRLLLGYVRDGELLLIVGSAGGAPRHPAWYHNLLAHPQVRVEIGTETLELIAVPAEGARRDRLFERVVSVAPGYADYQTATTRTLPVVVLEPSGAEAAEGPGEIGSFADKLVQIHG
ncbi:nitroreductase/quinone reductase family protein, partial [Streptomyces scopuliridis]|uniref:nitroreductase/quinone reductase family protein n=1 Tax=Streptomyces scopuliridis TaxID=452529 RepID=UPI00342AA147